MPFALQNKRQAHDFGGQVIWAMMHVPIMLLRVNCIWKQLPCCTGPRVIWIVYLHCYQLCLYNQNVHLFDNLLRCTTYLHGIHLSGKTGYSSVRPERVEMNCCVPLGFTKPGPCHRRWHVNSRLNNHNILNNHNHELGNNGLRSTRHYSRSSESNMKYLLLLCPFYRWGYWDTESFQNLSICYNMDTVCPNWTLHLNIIPLMGY